MSEEPEDVDVLVNYMGIIVTEYISAQDEDPEQFIKVNYTYMRFGNHRCGHCMHAVGCIHVWQSQVDGDTGSR